MMKHRENLKIFAYWYCRPLTGREYIDVMCGFLKRLKARFAEFSEIHIVTETGTSPIAGDFGNFQQELVRWLPKERSYINKDNPDNYEFTLDSTAGVAFSSGFTNGVNPSEKVVCYLHGSMGCPDDSANNFIIELTPDMENADFVVELLKETIAFWSPNHASLTRQSYGDSLKQPVGDIRVGWLTYIKSAEVAPFVPSQCTAESFHEGTLIRALPQVPSRSGEEIIPTLLEIRDALNARGILANPRKRLNRNS